MPSTSEIRFWSRVNKTETCWLWTGKPLNSGYGWASINGKRGLAHRLSYEMHIGWEQIDCP